MTLDILLKEMQITPDQQFRLIGVGVYALSTQEPLPQLSLWSEWLLNESFFNQKNKNNAI